MIVVRVLRRVKIGEEGEFRIRIWKMMGFARLNMRDSFLLF